MARGAAEVGMPGSLPLGAGHMSEDCMMWRGHCSSCPGLPVDVAPEEKALLRAGWSRLGLEWHAIAVGQSRAEPTSESVKSTAAACLLWLPFVGI